MLQCRKVRLVCEDKALQLHSNDGEAVIVEALQMLSSDQEETDTRVILYAAYARDKGYKYARVRSPDSDIFFILLHFALNLLPLIVLFDTGTGNKRRIITVTELARSFTQQMCTSLLSLHAYMRCATTSAFKGIGKVKPIKMLQKHPKFQSVFEKLGEQSLWIVPDELLRGLEEFTYATCIYGRSRFKNINEF